MIKKARAFTIVELLVVMAVIGILLTLAVIGIQQLQKSQRETTRLNDIRNVQAQLEAYYGRAKKYPDFTQLALADNVLTMTYLATAFSSVELKQLGAALSAPTNATNGYTSEDCTDVASADSWTIFYSTGGQNYALFACTENGKSQNFGASE